MGTHPTTPVKVSKRAATRWAYGIVLAELACSPHARAQSTFELFSLGDAPAEMHAISPDGAVAVGRAQIAPWGERPVVWRRGQGFSVVDDGVSISCNYLAISADGNMVGGGVILPEGSSQSFIAPLGRPELNLLAYGVARGMSGDASVVLGLDFRWELGSGLTLLAPGNDRFLRGRGISRDGRVIVGEIQDEPPLDYNNLPCLWFDRGRSFAILPQLPGTHMGWGAAFAADSDGRAVVGYASDPIGGQWVAVRWVDGVPERLGIAPGHAASVAYAINGDGSLVVGYSAANLILYGSVWTRATGMMDLDEYLLARGVQIPEEWHTYTCNAVSDDGSVFAGIAMTTDPTNVRFKAFVATLRPPCPADFNLDGGVDGADVEAFFRAWELSQPSADTNQDGGIDGADAETFFGVWESGGC